MSDRDVDPDVYAGGALDDFREETNPYAYGFDETYGTYVIDTEAQGWEDYRIEERDGKVVVREEQETVKGKTPNEHCADVGELFTSADDLSWNEDWGCVEVTHDDDHAALTVTEVRRLRQSNEYRLQSVRDGDTFLVEPLGENDEQ